MKEETYIAKLNKLLGISAAEEDVQALLSKPRKINNSTYEVSEDMIQNFREIQGLTYFLQAPALFQPKTCKHCGADFLVSRLYVAYCSVTCIRASLNELGIAWTKGNNIEALIEDPNVWGGQEPIWIRNIESLRQALQRLTEFQSSPTNQSQEVR